jgi:hypothetical protein
MTRKLKLVPVLFFVVLLSAFTNPGDSTPTGDPTPTGGGVSERRFWGKEVSYSACQGGYQYRTTKSYIFWIETGSETTQTVCGA